MLGLLVVLGILGAIAAAAGSGGENETSEKNEKDEKAKDLGSKKSSGIGLIRDFDAIRDPLADQNRDPLKARIFRPPLIGKPAVLGPTYLRDDSGNTIYYGVDEFGNHVHFTIDAYGNLKRHKPAHW